MQSISRVPQSQIAWPTEPTQSVHSSLSTEPFHILRAHLNLSSSKTKPFLNSLLVESPNRLTADCITLLSLSFSRTSLAYSMLSFCTASLEDSVSSVVTFYFRFTCEASPRLWRPSRPRARHPGQPWSGAPPDQSP